LIGGSARRFGAYAHEQLISPGWDRDSFNGLLASSVVALAVRPGNPRRVTGWAPPARGVVIADPRRSQLALTELLGAYGGLLSMTRSQRVARARLRNLVRHAVLRRSEAAALRAFKAGHGVAWLTTEAGALRARRAGARVQVLVPQQTLVLPVPVAVATTSRWADLALAALDALHGAAAQRLVAADGLRPVLDGLRDPRVLPTIDAGFSLGFLGGWNTAVRRLFARRTGMLSDLLPAAARGAGRRARPYRSTR
jgi:ABC-type sulfate transport system substrate-binding protein